MANTKYRTSLVALGLSLGESQIYLALLTMRMGNVSDLAKHTGMHRSKTSEALQGLKELGLVSTVQKGKRTLFIPEHPEGLRHMIMRQSSGLEEILPELTEQFSQRPTQPLVRLFSGKAGVKGVYEDLLRTLKKGEVFFRYESPEDYKAQDQYLPRAYFERVCDKREIEKFVITNEVTSRSKSKQLERSTKVVPREFDAFTYNLTQIIYAHKVAYIDFDTETAWIIEHERFATFQRQLFKLLHQEL